MRFRNSLLAGIAIFFATTLSAQTLYKATLLRAAPGQLLELIDALKAEHADMDNAPYMMRHSQGDHWDLFLLQHLPNNSREFSIENLKAGDIRNWSLGDKVAFREELIVTGPAFDVVQDRYARHGFCHIEMFVSLPGKHKELYLERMMENKYLEEIKRPQNLIFSKVYGAEWDNFTIGFYRDMRHYAESENISLEDEEAAAIKAGFKGVTDISPYLRSLIREHHDTLARVVK